MTGRNKNKKENVDLETKEIQRLETFSHDRVIKIHLELDTWNLFGSY